MLTVDYRTLQDGVCDLVWGTNEGVPDANSFTRMRGLFSRRLAYAYEYAWWPDLVRTEQREFRATWSSAATYAASTATVPVEVFDPRSGNYFQSLRATVFAVQPTSITGAIEYFTWYPCQTTYSGNDWADATAYTSGSGGVEPSVVRNTDDGRYYACKTSHTSSGSFDSSKFTVLTPFDRYVAYEQTGETKIGTVQGVFENDPRNFLNPGQIDFTLTGNGVNVVEGTNQPWIRFRLQPPPLKGAAFSTSTAYTANVSQVYFRDESAIETYPGNFYNCTTNHSAGAWNASNFTLVEIPRFLERYLIQAVYADWLPGDGQNDKRRLEQQLADRLLEQQFLLLRGQQRQTFPTTVIRN